MKLLRKFISCGTALFALKILLVGNVMLNIFYWYNFRKLKGRNYFVYSLEMDKERIRRIDLIERRAHLVDVLRIMGRPTYLHRNQGIELVYMAPLNIVRSTDRIPLWFTFDADAKVLLEHNMEEYISQFKSMDE